MTPVNPMQILGAGFTIAAEVGAAYESYEASSETALVVPPIRAYIGADHIEIDITIKRLT